MTKEELNKHFVAWFYNENWVDNYNRNGWMRDHYNNLDADQRHYWMLEAFMAGYNLDYKLEQEEMATWFEGIIENNGAPTTTIAVDQEPWPFPLPK